MPAPPAAMVNGIPMAEQCDEEEPGYDALNVDAPVVISWAALRAVIRTKDQALDL